ncbi:MULTISPECIES: BCCT family transporter [Streptomyces]|uniref:BCCT transporter n=1 Tax=Streptomyces venezuelae TaxID=54571 RepID=A0A5P2BJP0_STRVZ|nr:MULTISPECIES: BCCT family transporter [Streptomyces]NEA02060.1 BCCT family transporter [Streptomyces sp. SID10116]MYY85405.1 BCCT family transporter [Streptomyces sp. SID335]MYZ17435.1 BCCT family transporter [Streptomyces sp. SID337]NDZ85502.1 BCCT family transporter [Streptomyces sp. SID10115]NEB48751.1 BCCT family transporter [Streptomyces sp. SID339]
MAPAPGGRSPQTDRVVFGVTAVLTLAFVVWGAVSTDSLENVSTDMLNGLMHNGGWFFMLTATGFVVFALWLAVSRYGKITLGNEGEDPEFRTVSWVAMMFSAGMGIGLMFYGVSEPLAHFKDHPPGTDPADAPAAMETAMATTLFHWTLHPWAIYAVVGLAIAYSTFRRNRRQTISAVFEPLIGEKHARGAWGRVIDILAIFATLFGSAASLGLGALQIGSGMEEVDWMDKAGTGLLVVIIAVLTLAFVASAISGVEKGVQWLSNINMVLAGLLVVFVFIAGPTVIILDMVPTSIGAYLNDLPQLIGRTEASSGEGVAEWLSSWTVFYWAWWISWTPFVGMFIARISRGRTIRQFVGGVILVPSTVSLIWFAVFGGSAMTVADRGGLKGDTTQEAQLFGLLNEYPIATVTSLLVMILVGIFFVSGADAASIVMGTLSQKGALEPGRFVVIFWGIVTGAVGAIMLLIGDGNDDALTGLRNLTILVAAPFTIVMIGMCVALMRDLRHDPLIVRGEHGTEVLEKAVIAGHEHHDGDFELQIGPATDDNGDGPERDNDPVSPR